MNTWLKPFITVAWIVRIGPDKRQSGHRFLILLFFEGYSGYFCKDFTAMKIRAKSIHIEENVSLKPYNTFGVEAQTQYLAHITRAEELNELSEIEEFKDIPWLLLGGGSNVLFVNDFNGLVLINELRGKELLWNGSSNAGIKVMGGEVWDDFVEYCVNQGWGGIENLSLIPGKTGAAPIQNIGAYGVELENVFVELEAYNFKTGKWETFKKEDCRFGYRDSIFKKQLKDRYFITSVTLKLSKKPELKISYPSLANKLENRDHTQLTINDVREAVITIRRSKLPDPEKLGNAGSFFKNPVVGKIIYKRLNERYPGIPGYPFANGTVKIPAGWLIEQCGWKGKKLGKVGTHHKQALVIVNFGGAKGKEILEVAKKVRSAVEDQFGIRLQPEVNIIGGEIR